MREKFVISLVAQFIITVYGLFASYILVLFLDVSLMGVWALLNSIIGLGFAFADMGISNIHYQFSRKENFDDYLGSFLTIKLFLMIVDIFLTFGLFTILKLWNSPYIFILLLMLISRCFNYIGNALIKHLNAKTKIFKAEIPHMFFMIGRDSVKLYVALNLKNISDPFLIIVSGFIFFNCLQVLFIIFLFKKDFKINLPNKVYIIEYFKAAKFLLVNSVLLTIITHLGNIILDLSFGHKVLAYFYLVNNIIIPILLAFKSSMDTVFTPIFSRSLAQGDQASVSNILHKSEKYFSIVYLCIIINVYIVGEILFLLFLPNYLNSLPILYLLVFTPLIKSINRNYNIILISGEKQDLSSFLSFINHTSTLVLILVLVPKNLFFISLIGWGMFGLVVALLVPSIIEIIYIRYFVHRIFNIEIKFEILFHFILAIITIVICFIIKLIFIDNIIENLVLKGLILIILTLGIFIGSLISLKLLKREDYYFIRNLLKIKNYYKSIKEEL